MLIKLLVSVFERAKSKLISSNSNDRNSSDSENEIVLERIRPSSSSFIVEQPVRHSLAKWFCSTPATIDRSSFGSKSNKVRRSSSWRSLKERGNNYLEHFTSRTLSVDELHRNGKKSQKINSTHQQQQQQQRRRTSTKTCDVLQSPLIPFHRSHRHPIRLSNIDVEQSPSSFSQRFDRLSSNLIQYSNPLKKSSQPIVSRHNTSSGGADSGYSEESFAWTRNSSQIRPLHTSCPHCHCEQRSSFQNYQKKSLEQLSRHSSTSDTTIHQDLNLRHFSSSQGKSLSTSRSYPHIKPLPKTTTNLLSPIIDQQEQQRQTRTLSVKRRSRRRRRRHLSCDGTLCSKNELLKPIDLRCSSLVKEPIDRSFPSDFRTPLPKPSEVFGELNLAAIELDSLRTISYCSSHSSSITSSSSSLNSSQKLRKKSRSSKCSREKGTFLVWHQYENSSLLSSNNEGKIFSVVRGDQVRLLRRIGKSTLLVQKDDDGSIGFLPQSCLADDQIQSFLSVKGLKETVL